MRGGWQGDGERKEVGEGEWEEGRGNIEHRTEHITEQHRNRHWLTMSILNMLPSVVTLTTTACA